MLRLNKNLQTVKLKYILITLVLRRAFSRPFVLELLLCQLAAQEAKRRNEGYKRPAPSAGLVGLN